MLEKIPDYSRNPLKQIPASSVADMPPLRFLPSHYLWCAEAIVYSALWVFATVALGPFFLSDVYWMLLWLLFTGMVFGVVRVRRRIYGSAPLTLIIKGQDWQLLGRGLHTTVSLCDEVLLWEWLIILPVRESLTGRKHYLVALPDSLSADDWRRLRVWLRTSLHR